MQNLQWLAPADAHDARASADTHRFLPPLNVHLLAGEEVRAKALGNPLASLRNVRLEGVVGVGLGRPHGRQLGCPRLHLPFFGRQGTGNLLYSSVE